MGLRQEAGPKKLGPMKLKNNEPQPESDELKGE